ncbi:alpha/beta hydrolase [Verminephrobacter aporrectodeae subsp. tuberculatae]|uniref:alpha/beta hydrolase n=1 Tax=Verminephrobacter aporrectodeae TaxID=1110389 RepID=UPI0022446875|nr:alpha/beta hydrolase [Verminephrobacter aporrectodeae]MCW8166960.1 alpha/beta hydrolase [Verminephrobacter aporrectodeae subsp. tuberculatae]MCW8171113.1 alpha/beta hydrolase [Verminephrobacter aporrectodeae subsp. tuberculatae]
MLTPDIADFVARTAAVYPAHAATLPVAEQRLIYDRYAASFTPPLPEGVRTEDRVFHAAAGHRIALRLYRPPPGGTRGCVLYFHGGGFVLGSLDSHQVVTARLAADTGLRVIAVDYRLAPEHPAPAAHEDCLEVTRAALAGRLPGATDAPLLLAGDSAGASVAAGIALRLRDAGCGKIAGMALVYPMLGDEPQPPARDTEAHAPMLTLADIHAFRRHYWGAARPPDWIAPLNAQRFDGLPPTLAIGVEHDPLRDDPRVFAERIQAAGGTARSWCGVGMVHGCWRALEVSVSARRLHDEVCRFLRDSADNAAHNS